MTRADDILNQIDAALGDPFVGPDAMRCGPVEEAPKTGAWVSHEGTGPRVWIAPVGTDPDDADEWQLLGYATSVTISADVPDVPATPTDSDRGAARLYLIGRLVANHGLNTFEAGDAVDEAAAGLDGPHTHLARVRNLVAIDEFVGPAWEFLHRLAAAMRPAMENAARAMQQLAEAARAAAASSPTDFALAPPQPSRPDDRPAWQSPYGPAARRRP